MVRPISASEVIVRAKRDKKSAKHHLPNAPCILALCLAPLTVVYFVYYAWMASTHRLLEPHIHVVYYPAYHAGRHCLSICCVSARHIHVPLFRQLLAATVASISPLSSFTSASDADTALRVAYLLRYFAACHAATAQLLRP